MFLVPPSSDNPIQWHYTLISGEETLHIQQVGARVELIASTEGPLDDAAWEQLIVALKSDFGRLGRRIKKVRDDLERWTVFVNPYFRLEAIVADFHARLDDLRLPNYDAVETPEAMADTPNFEKSINQMGKEYGQAAELGLTLRMITPVWAEAFVNLVIFLFAKADVRSNDRLYQDVIRKEIDVRLAGLHLNCEGFQRQLDMSSQELRDLLTVMNSRNDFLHGNVDPTRLAVDEVYFDGKRPIYPRHQTLIQRALDPRLKFIEPDAVKQDVCRVEAFIAYVLECLEPGHRKALQLFMNSPLPGWRSDTMRPGILFSDPLVDIFLPEKESNDA